MSKSKNNDELEHGEQETRQLNDRDSKDLQIKISLRLTMNCCLVWCGLERMNPLQSALCVIHILVVLILGGRIVKDIQTERVNSNKIS